MGDFSSQGHLEHLAYVVRMAICSQKFDRFTSQFPNFSPAARKNSTLLRVRGIGRRSWWTRMDAAAARSLLLR